jgi:hypothetical protein
MIEENGVAIEIMEKNPLVRQGNVSVRHSGHWSWVYRKDLVSRHSTWIF